MNIQKFARRIRKLLARGWFEIALYQFCRLLSECGTLKEQLSGTEYYQRLIPPLPQDLSDFGVEENQKAQFQADMLKMLEETEQLVQHHPQIKKELARLSFFDTPVLHWLYLDRMSEEGSRKERIVAYLVIVFIGLCFHGLLFIFPPLVRLMAFFSLGIDVVIIGYLLILLLLIMFNLKKLWQANTRGRFLTTTYGGLIIYINFCVFFAVVTVGFFFVLLMGVFDPSFSFLNRWLGW